MAGEKIIGNRVISGAYGELWWGNLKIAEVKSLKAKITVNREDVQLGISVDSKMVGLVGEGDLVLEKCFTRAKPIIQKWQKGMDERVRFVGAIKDPDATGSQEERVSIDNVWFKELPLIQFEKGAKMTEEIPFGFTPEDAEFESSID